MNTDIEKFKGCLYGLAIGDALGYPIEFETQARMHTKYGASGISDFVKFRSNDQIVEGLYSDDTQMSLAVANALISSQNTNSLENVMNNISEEFVHWLETADPRAPGYTCIEGCKKMKLGVYWCSSGNTESKGCGAAMRTAPIGLFYEDVNKIVETARAASICTHSHPTGVASGIATALFTYYAKNNENPESMIDNVIENIAKHDTLGEMKNILLLTKDISKYEPLEAMQKLCNGLKKAEKNDSGLGWTGEEAVAAAVYAFLGSPNDYRKTVLTAANTTLNLPRPNMKADVDSIACIAGAISGAYNGMNAVPQEWIKKIENSELLRSTARKLCEKSKIDI
jgi:ADP-ribosylglycohydrolase